MNAIIKLHGVVAQGSVRIMKAREYAFVAVPGGTVQINSGRTKMVRKSKQPFRIVRGEVYRVTYDPKGRPKREFLHRLVMGVKKNRRVFFLDGDKCNCCDWNLSFELHPADRDREVDPELVQWLAELLQTADTFITGKFERLRGPKRQALVEEIVSDAFTEVARQLKATKSRIDFLGKGKFFAWCMKILYRTGQKRQHQFGDVPDGLRDYNFNLDDFEPVNHMSSPKHLDD